MRAMRILMAIILLALISGDAFGQKPRRMDAARDPSLQQQDRDRSRQTLPADESRADIERILPYLAYTLGELHYLSFACDGNDQQVWRDRMVELLAMEAGESGRRRDQLIDAFNDGYRSQQRYRARCGPEVEAERRSLAYRGRDLSEMMRSAYFD